MPCPAARNTFGQSIETRLLPDEARPLSDAAFSAALGPILETLAEADADGIEPSGASCRHESQDDEFPTETAVACPMQSHLERLWLRLPLHSRKCTSMCVAIHPVKSLSSSSSSMRRLKPRPWLALNECLASRFWRGKDGVLWRLAHKKTRLKAIGPPGGVIPLGNYNVDYALFGYTQVDGNDARLALTADFFVDYNDEDLTYERIEANSQ